MRSMLLAAVAMLVGSSGVSGTSRHVTLTGWISVDYREFRLVDGPAIMVPSFSLHMRCDGGESPADVKWPLVVTGHGADVATLSRLAERLGEATVEGTTLEINHHTFVSVESIKENCPP